nr:PREDICTED: cytochrome c oxidase assembly protein COX11, mitochondrial [Bemisia tabaci]
MLAVLRFSIKPSIFHSVSASPVSTTPIVRLCNQCELYFRNSVNTLQTRYFSGLSVKTVNCHSSLRHFSSNPLDVKKRKTTLNYVIAGTIFCCAASFAAVPLYRIFCASTSYAGTVTHGDASEKIAEMKPVKSKPIKITFNADVSSSLQWNFKPLQREIIVRPGETALAFYTATNPSNNPIVGVSSYNVLPFEAGQYFVKIQCFCFEEQQLNPHEEVDMPVFFYIDPEFTADPKMEFVNEILLSYTFFEAKEGSKLLEKIPSYARKHILPKEPQLSAA